jgi:hypothetical protein
MTARPFDRALALLDPLLASAAFVVESDDIFGGTRVGDDEADARIRIVRMPLEFGDDPARMGPAEPHQRREQKYLKLSMSFHRRAPSLRI